MSSANSEKMKAVVYRNANEVEVVEKDIPTPGPGEVVVKVTSSGLCGSDLHNYRAEASEFASTGFTMGHELTGYIHSVGPAETSQDDAYPIDLRPGLRVVCPFTTSCGSCWFCSRGMTGRCVKGSLIGCPKLEGAQAGYVKIPLARTTLFEAPKGMPDGHLILMADIFPTGCFVVKNAWDMLVESERKQSTALVIGCGPVGLCAIMAARARFDKVFAIDPVPERMEMAKKYGAIPLEQKDGSYTQSLRSHAEHGPDVVLEVVGNPSAHALAIDLVRIGGIVSSCGVHSAALTISGDVAYNKNLKFSFGRCHVRAMFPYALELLQKIGKETPELLDEFVQKTVKIDEAPEYYRLFNERKVGKVVFEFDH